MSVHGPSRHGTTPCRRPTDDPLPGSVRSVVAYTAAAAAPALAAGGGPWQVTPVYDPTDRPRGSAVVQRVGDGSVNGGAADREKFGQFTGVVLAAECEGQVGFLADGELGLLAAHATFSPLRSLDYGCRNFARLFGGQVYRLIVANAREVVSLVCAVDAEIHPPRGPRDRHVITGQGMDVKAGLVAHS